GCTPLRRILSGSIEMKRLKEAQPDDQPPRAATLEDLVRPCFQSPELNTTGADNPTASLVIQGKTAQMDRKNGQIRGCTPCASLLRGRWWAHAVAGTGRSPGLPGRGPWGR